MFKFKFILLSLVLMGALAACKNSEERAEEYYQSALVLLEEGDTERAVLELRNVFDYNGEHREARRLYADLSLERGNVQEAYSQYLLLVEQYPDAVDVRRKLAEIALDLGNLAEVKRHSDAAIEMEPDIPEHQALAVFLAYSDARQSQDAVAAGEAVQDAEALLQVHPDLITALRILIDWHATSPVPARALSYIDHLLMLHPNARSLYTVRLSVLQRSGRDEEIGPQLHQMYERFPDDTVIVDQMVKWYHSRGEYKTLEAFLRDRAGAPDAPLAGHMTVVTLLKQLQGDEAAMQELHRLAEANTGTDLGRKYILQQALLEFQSNAGPHVIKQAMDDVSRIIEQADDPDLINEARISLSRMKSTVGDQKTARALVDAVLESDPSNVPGLRARAARDIREDNMSKAISGLRQALGQEPRNADTLLLLADAQQKMGNVELAEQRLAQAVEITNSAPREALVYAHFQMNRGQLAAADRVLTDSFGSTGDMKVANLLGEVMLKRGDLKGAQNLLQALANSQSPNAAPLARSLQAAILFNQNRVDEGFAFLRNSIEEGDENGQLSSGLKILRIQMLSGRLQEARKQIDLMQEQFPDTLVLKLLKGNLYALEGFPEKAIETYRALLVEHPDDENIIQRLYSTLRETDRRDEASALLKDALTRQPDASRLLVLRAIELEEELQSAEAIAIYEALYRKYPDNVIYANNLASMLATHREDPAEIKRAYTIAQRLNGVRNPAMLDTLGWVQYLNEETDAAVLNLQAAARGLPGNPTVAFNLAHAYAQARRTDEARAELNRGFSLANGDETVPQYSRAKELLKQLDG